MRLRRITLPALLVLTLPLCARAQDPHVHSEYSKDEDTSRVYTDFMHVMDTPEQFMQLQLGARFRGRQMKKAPGVLLEIWSISRKALYRGGGKKGTKLTVTVDGETAQSPVRYMRLKGVTRHGKDLFIDESEFLSTLGGLFKVESPLPDDAKIRSGKKIDGMKMERMFVSMSAETFLKIAAARKIELMLDNTAFGFTDNHLNTIRDLARRITPGADAKDSADKTPTP